MTRPDDEEFSIERIERNYGRNDAIRVSLRTLSELDHTRFRILDEAWTEAPHYEPGTRARLARVRAQQIETLLDLSALFALADMHEYAAIADQMVVRLRQEGLL